MKMDKPNQPSICPLQCPGLDSNQHADESTTTSKWLVYQFQHLGFCSPKAGKSESPQDRLECRVNSFGLPDFPSAK